MEKKGLSSAEAAERLHLFGFNELEHSHSIEPLKIFLSQFPTFINGILTLAAILSFFLGEYLDGFFILGIIFLNGVFGFIQEYKAEKSLEKLKTYTSPTVRVIRDGQEQEINAREIVPGDMVVLSEGDRIPADGVLLEAINLEIDESILTGESLPVRKEKKDECSLGTLISKGRGLMEVSTTGMKTRFGQIAKTLTSIKPEKTPLQKQLTELGKILSLAAVVIAFLIIPIGFIQNKEFGTLLFLAVSVGIAAIPEGLPAVITIALAIGTNRMAKRKAIVRQMPSVETLGSVQIILVDKTGTLTQNSMRVKKIWAKDDSHLALMLKAALLGNTASLIARANGTFDIAGDRTDGALLAWATEQDKTLQQELKKGEIIDEFVFDSKTKTITTVWEFNDSKHVFVRGAPEAVLLRSKGSQNEKEELQKSFEKFAKEGLRVIAFGAKNGNLSKSNSREEHEKDLTFLGFVGIYDPPRAEVKTAIAQARRAGIRTIMVTGDNELTALAIGKEIGLIENDEDVITGDELEKISDSDLFPILTKVRIFARTKPHDKLRITELLQKQGYVVGVTGDGVNDALALKKANIGVAMGQTGTDVAKEASDIVIADDNFATIVKAIEEGRTIYKNIVTAIMYLLTSNLSELSVVFFSTLLGMPHVLLPTQILWINLVTDGLPALALATETKKSHVLSEKPRNPQLPILTTTQILILLGIGVGLALILLILYGLLLQSTSLTAARTIIFNALVFSHMLLAFIIRGRSFLSFNPFLIITVTLTLVIQIIITTLPFFQKIFAIGF